MSSMTKSPEQVAALYTPRAKRVIAAFEGFVDGKLGSRKRGARRLGCNPTTIGRLFRHIYPGNVDGYVARMEEVLRIDELRSRMPDAPPFTEINTTHAVHRTMQIAHRERRIAAVLGGTGVGKTCAVREYANRNEHVAYLVAGCTGSKSVVARRICERLGLETKGRMCRLRDIIIEHLQGTDWLLVVDEIDEVPRQTLRLLREIVDEAHVGLVIIGTESFLQDLRARGNRVINQFLGRVAYVELVPPIGRDDVEAIAEPYGLESAALDVLEQAAEGQARRVVALLVAAQRMNGKQITVRSIRKARRQLMPILKG